MQDRGNTYWLNRLKTEHPAVHADWQAGKYRSARQALIAAGLRKPASVLNLLRNAWKGASAKERQTFLRWIGHGSARSKTSIVDANFRLEPSAAARIKTIIHKRNLKIGEVMDEMGFGRRDTSLGYALNNNSRISLKLATALDAWLRTNRNI